MRENAATQLKSLQVRDELRMPLASTRIVHKEVSGSPARKFPRVAFFGGHSSAHCRRPLGTGVASSPLMIQQQPRVLRREDFMNGVIYLVGLIVVILAILSFFGLH
jgi:hypothetical protein